jgi:NCS1 family nucleobase:cation symporter-1
VNASAASPVASEGWERLALDPVPRPMRHGHSRDSGWLWFAANLGLPPWSLGVLAVALGLSPMAAALAVVVGNLVGAALMASVAGLGPETGLPAIALTRRLFGAWPNRLPSVLNALSCLGWYAVNAVLGGEALARLFGLPLVWGLVLLTLALGLVAAIGHDLVHRVERAAAYVLALLFLFTAVRLFTLHPHLTAHLTGGGALPFGTFLLAVAIVASYLFSWSPYATDYARYLPEDTPRGAVFRATFVGAFVSSAGVELLGILTAVAVGSQGSPVDVMARAMGAFTAPALAAVVLGTLTANALNVYTGGLSSLSAGVRIGRPLAAALFAVLGGVAAYVGARGFYAGYENFLLLISYWVAPWIGVVLADSLGRDPRRRSPEVSPPSGLLFAAFLVGLVATVPFMNQALYEGPVARLLGGGDVGYWAGVIVAFVLARIALARAAAPPKAVRLPPPA